MTAKLYKKRPITISAEQFFPDKLPWPDGVIESDEANPLHMWWIETLEGVLGFAQ